MTALSDRPRDDGGFTLLEVLLALAILAIALPVLLGLRNRDLDFHARAGELTTATILAQEKLLESELSAIFPVGETTGTFENRPLGVQDTGFGTIEPRPTGYRWKRIIAPTPLQGVREVKIQVMWPRGAVEEMVEVSTYVFSPSFI